MRFIVSYIVLFRAKKKYLPAYTKNLYQGWKSKEDKKAIKEIIGFVLQRLKNVFIFKARFKEDIKACLLIIKNNYNPQTDADELSYSFSIKKVLNLSLLAFSDFYKEYAQYSWFKILRNIPIGWFYRVINLRRYYNLLFSFPFLDKLKQARILGKILRIMLIPILGLPTFLYYIIKSVVISIFYEGFFRWFYALLLLKLSYYFLYLYGRDNTQISKRVKAIPKSRLGNMNKQVNTLITPKNWEKKSNLFWQAYAVYNNLLQEFGLATDNSNGATKSSLYEKGKIIIERIGSIVKRAYAKQSPFAKQISGYRQELLRLYYVIGMVYAPKAKEPIFALRIGEVLEIGYMASVILLHKVMATPGIAALLDKISGNFAIKIKVIAGQDIIKSTGKKVKDIYKYYRLYRMGSRAFKVIRGIAAPYTLLWSAGSPLLWQQLEDLIKGYIFHRAGRLLLYGGEMHILRKKNNLNPILW